MASGIKDKVVIAGMGCSRFGERWSCGPDDLMVEAFEEAMTDAGLERDRIEAAWLGVFFDEQSTGKSSLPMSMALRLPNIPTTRVENLCATGTEALRGAVYAVAAGACDIALAMGVEKLKDTGFAPRARLRTSTSPPARRPAPSHSWRAHTPGATGTRCRS
jgi:acetyl-CoA C-acetyltransferase